MCVAQRVSAWWREGSERGGMERSCPIALMTAGDFLLAVPIPPYDWLINRHIVGGAVSRSCSALQEVQSRTRKSSIPRVLANYKHIRAQTNWSQPAHANLI